MAFEMDFWAGQKAYANARQNSLDAGLPAMIDQYSGNPSDVGILGKIAMANPNVAQSLVQGGQLQNQGMQASSQIAVNKQKMSQEALKQVGKILYNTPDEQKPMVWANAVQNANANGYDTGGATGDYQTDTPIAQALMQSSFVLDPLKVSQIKNYESQIKARETKEKTQNIKPIYKDGSVIFADPVTQKVNTVTIDNPEKEKQKEELNQSISAFNKAKTPEEKLSIASRISAIDPKIANSLISGVNAGTSIGKTEAQVDYWGKQGQQGDQRLVNEAKRIEQQDARNAELAKNNEISQEARQKEIDIQERRLQSDKAMKEKGYNIKQLDTVRAWQGEVEQTTKGQREIINRANHIKEIVQKLKEGKLETNVAKQQILINFGKLTEPTNALMQGEAMAFKETDDLISTTWNSISSMGRGILTPAQVADIDKLTKTAQELAKSQIQNRIKNVNETAPKYGLDPKEITSILDGYIQNDASEKSQKARNDLRSLFGGGR